MTATPNKGYPLPVVSGNPNIWGVLLNQGFGIVDSNLGGFTTVNCAGSSNVTITSVQAQNLIMQLTGILTGNIQVIMPAVGGFNILDNQTTGAFTITVVSAGGGTTTLLAQGNQALTYNDTTNQHLIAASYNIANNNVLANITGSTAPAVGVGVSALLDSYFGATQGEIIYRGASTWAALAPGTNGQALICLGPATNPAWTTVGIVGGGTVTSVATGTGLTGGPFSISGTIGRDPVYDELIVIWAR